jgi:hypothetical protein
LVLLLLPYARIIKAQERCLHVSRSTDQYMVGDTSII